VSGKTGKKMGRVAFPAVCSACAWLTTFGGEKPEPFFEKFSEFAKSQFRHEISGLAWSLWSERSAAFTPLPRGTIP
jgi:hypothetical protein